MDIVEIREGKTTFFIQKQNPDDTFPPGSTSVFFNKKMELNRDVTTLLLNIIKPENYLDAMGASGVRGLRVANECNIPVTINDRDSDAVDLIEYNAKKYDSQIEVTNADANVIMSGRRFDAVDLDPFGTPAPFIDAAAGSAKNYLFVTATDTAPLCGAHLKAGMRRYFACPMNTEYHSEVGLRVLLGFVVREIVKYDRGVVPLFCFAKEHFVRLHLRVVKGAKRADETMKNIGYIHQCMKCPYRTEQNGMLPKQQFCKECGAPLEPIGPLWLGSISDKSLIDEMLVKLPEMEPGKSAQIERLLAFCRDELDTSTFYDYHKLSKLWKLSPAAIDVVIALLKTEGYEASRTHYTGTGIKTTAPLEILKKVIRGG